MFFYLTQLRSTYHEYPIVRFLVCIIICNSTNVIQMQNYKPILKKKGHFYCQNFGFIYINQCFSHKISYFFEIRIVNVHISIKVFVSNKINLVKITPVKEISTFRTSYFSYQVVFQVVLCLCNFITGKYHGVFVHA